jgi:tryptophan-rich sensory protein
MCHLEDFAYVHVKQKAMFKTLERIPKVIAWLQIALAPFIIGGIAGFLIYANRPDTIGLALAIVTFTIGVLLGIVWANLVNKKRGVIEHMSRVIATPELDQQANNSI